jgi:hypothetical protein
MKKFPVNSLFLKQDCEIWAEIEGFGREFEKFPAFFPVIA